MNAVNVRVIQISDAPSGDQYRDARRLRVSILPENVGSDTSVEGLEILTTSQVWHLVFSNPENCMISFSLTEPKLNNSEICRLTIPLFWLPKGYCVREQYPMRPNYTGMMTPMISLDAHFCNAEDQPFRAPSARLTVMPAWKMPRLMPAFMPPPNPQMFASAGNAPFATQIVRTKPSKFDMNDEQRQGQKVSPKPLATLSEPQPSNLVTATKPPSTASKEKPIFDEVKDDSETSEGIELADDPSKAEEAEQPKPQQPAPVTQQNFVTQPMSPFYYTQFTQPQMYAQSQYNSQIISGYPGAITKSHHHHSNPSSNAENTQKNTQSEAKAAKAQAPTMETAPTEPIATAENPKRKSSFWTFGQEKPSGVEGYSKMHDNDVEPLIGEQTPKGQPDPPSQISETFAESTLKPLNPSSVTAAAA